MKKLKLLIASCALLLGWSNASAYTVSDLTSAGWTQVTDATITGIADNYYMLVDANSSAYVMSAEADHYRPCYKTINNPVENPSFVWILEGSDNTFNLKSASTGAYFKQASGWNTSVGDGRNGSTASLQFTLSEGKYSIQCVGQGLVGHWNDDGAAVKEDGENIAANKAAKDAPGFYLYSISKATYNAALVAARATGVSSATKASPVNVTSYIQNADWSGDWGAWEFTCTSSGNIQWGQKTLESWNANNVVVKQVLTGVPNGLYKLSADVISGPGATHAAYVYAIGDSKVSGGTVSQDATENNYTTMSNEVAGNTLTADNVSVTGNSLTVGIDQSAGWIVADNFKLYYYGPTVAGNAIALPDGGAMAAGQWYFFDVETAADNYTATATTLGDIIYTTTGSTLIEDESGITANFAATDNSLSATRYYVKSSSAQSLAIAPASYSYSISEASANVSYIQAGNTVTVSYTTSSNDPDATLTQDYSGVTFDGNAISVTPTASGFTFTVPTVTANTDYTLAIPAGAIKYNEDNKNAAQNITLKTPVVFDGVYYFKKNDADLYITRGGWYGTEGVVDNFGLSFEVSAQADGTYTLKNIDHSLAANADKFLKCDGSTYTDQTAFNWTIEATDGGYYLRPSNTEYMAATAQGEYNYSYLSKTTDASSAYVWTLLSKSEYAAAIAAAKNSQATAIATAAGISATTVAELESALAADYGATDMTSSITNAALTANMTGWTQVKYNGATFKDADANGTTAEIWNSTGGVKQDIKGLPAGLYKVTVVATWRPGNLAAAKRVGAEANTTAWMYANTGTATNITQLKSWYEGGATINSRADLVTNKANYTNTTYVYVAEDETLTIGLASPSFCVEPWFPFFDWTLTRYEAKATPAEKTALAAAISAAEANTLGFEDGEYAPYNNVAAINALTAAKAIDPETASGSAVVAATTALTGAAWTANVGEVNAVYGGDFTKYETVGGQDLPYGWNLYNTGNNSRIMGGTEGSSNTGLSATSSGKALLMKFNATYGETAGYTMPLKAGKIYKISFKYGGWSNQPNTIVSLKDPSDAAITLAPNFRPETTDAHSDATHWYNYTGYFVSTTAGDYKLNFNKVENGQQQIVIADVELVSASELEFADGSVPTYAPGTYPSVKITRTLTANKWATAVYPFAVSGVGNIAVLDSYNSSTGTIGFTSAATSTANVPFLMMSESAKNEITLSNVTVVAASVDNATASEASLIGAYAATNITNDEKNYVLSNNEIFSVGEAGATINPYRAYIQLAEGGHARALRFVVDGQITGVDNVAAEASAEVKDGKYIENGKVVIVKNGKKFNANGQQVK